MTYKTWLKDGHTGFGEGTAQPSAPYWPHMMQPSAATDAETVNAGYVMKFGDDIIPVQPYEQKTSALRPGCIRCGTTIQSLEYDPTATVCNACLFKEAQPSAPQDADIVDAMCQAFSPGHPAENRHVQFMIEGGPVVMASDYDKLRQTLHERDETIKRLSAPVSDAEWSNLDSPSKGWKRIFRADIDALLASRAQEKGPGL